LGSLQTISAAEPITLGSPIDRFGVASQSKCGPDQIASQTPFVLRVAGRIDAAGFGRQRDGKNDGSQAVTLKI
jgi:hypothetical protein